jgi:hypothetical protein
MMVAEDETIMVEIVAEKDVAVLVAKEEVLHQEVAVSDQEKKEDSLIELQEMAVLKVQLQEENQVVLKEAKDLQEDLILQEQKEVQKELQDVRKVLVMHLDQEDQEKANSFS